MLTQSICFGDIKMFNYLMLRGVDLDYYDKLYPSDNILDFIIYEKQYKFLEILIRNYYCTLHIQPGAFLKLVYLSNMCWEEIARKGEENIDSKCCAFYNTLLDLIDLIFKHGNFDPFWIPDPDNGVSPLLIAIDAGNTGLEHILLSRGAEVMYDVDYWISSLHLTALHGYPNALRRILEKGVEDIDECTIMNMTALHLAAESGNLEIFKILVDHGANEEIRDVYGQTPKEAYDTSDNESYDIICEIISKEHYDTRHRRALHYRHDEYDSRAYVPRRPLLTKIEKKFIRFDCQSSLIGDESENNDKCEGKAEVKSEENDENVFDYLSCFRFDENCEDDDIQSESEYDSENDQYEDPWDDDHSDDHNNDDLNVFSLLPPEQ